MCYCFDKMVHMWTTGLHVGVLNVHKLPFFIKASLKRYQPSLFPLTSKPAFHVGAHPH